MINHARTLLLNVASTKATYADSGTDGYEFIPPEFKPVQIPDYMKIIRKTLFGASPDMLFMGLRAQELMTYIHQCEFESFATAFDSRVTYWPEIVSKKINTPPKKIIVAQTFGQPRRLTIAGDVDSNNATGLSYRSYSVYVGKPVANAADLYLRSRLLQDPFTVFSAPFSVGALQPVPLAGTGLTAVASDTELTGTSGKITTELDNVIISESFDGLETLTLEAPLGLNLADLYDVIARWYVVVRTYPKSAVLLLPELTKLGESPLVQLFGAEPVEPYVTFKNLWYYHPVATYKLAGLTLAIIYRLGDIQNGR